MPAPPSPLSSRPLPRAILRLVARGLGAPLASGVAVTAHPEPADAIVILGAPLGAGDALPPLAEERVRVGLSLFEQGLAPVICAVGGHCARGHEHTSAEAEGMARWLREAGVPERALRVDRLSHSTATNAARAAALLLPEGRRRVLLVTQPFHLRRACFHFRRAGFDPVGVRIERGVQDARPDRALRWIAREYAAWALAIAKIARTRARRPG
ncbi:MAG: YdcF family protein [Byssovorax sp.]